LFVCATSRATINVPLDQCYERVLAQAFWVRHCLSQVSEYMCTIATLPLLTASLILGPSQAPVSPCDPTRRSHTPLRGNPCRLARKAARYRVMATMLDHAWEGDKGRERGHSRRFL